LKLINNTKLSDTKILDIVNFVKPKSLSGFDVKVRCGSKSGRYKHVKPKNTFCIWLDDKPHNDFYFVGKRPLVCVNIPTDNLDQNIIIERKGGFNGYLSYKCYGVEEWLVHILAHEIRHHWQSKHKRRIGYKSKRGKYSERDADTYAIKKVREWRRKV